MKVKLFLVVMLGFFIKTPLWAQLPNQVLQDKIVLNREDSGRFGFSLNNTNYMRNTEYFNPIEEGRTLFGYQLQPKFSYQPSAHVKLEAGVWLRHDFGGNNPFTTALPTFSVKASKGKSEIIFGTLEGSLSHGMLEPLMDINSIIEKRIENGFQYKFTSRPIQLETWINWENYLEPGEFDKERFTAGLSANYSLLAPEAKNKFNVYYQFMASHQGGQIDTDTIQPFLMFYNAAAGLSYEYNLGSNQTATLNLAYLQFIELSESNVYTAKQGSGLLANLDYCRGATHWIMSYWNGNNFNAPRGTAPYQSWSTVDPKNYEANRQLLFFRFIHNKSLFNSPVMASVRFEPVYDLNNGLLDYSYSLYLVYNGDWKFGKGKKKN